MSVRMSFTLTAASSSVQLPSSHYLKGVKAARVRMLSYRNAAPAVDNLTLSIPQLNQGLHGLGDGTYEQRVVSMFLMPLDSVTALSNAFDWDSTFSTPIEISRLDFHVTLDGASAATQITSSNPVLVELEFQGARRA